LDRIINPVRLKIAEIETVEIEECLYVSVKSWGTMTPLDQRLDGSQHWSILALIIMSSKLTSVEEVGRFGRPRREPFWCVLMCFDK
jgi:hypothetical protein